MTGTDAIDPANHEMRPAHPPSLTVIAGLTYVERSQVFKRWCLPTYETLFRWTGNPVDAEDATSWVFKNAMAGLRLPALVRDVDERFDEATLDAACRHWSGRYGVAPYRCEALRTGRQAWSVEALVGGLSAEMRLVIVLRFLRKRSLSAIAAQLDAAAGSANACLHTALAGVAEQMGLDAPADLSQADEVAAFVDHLIDRRTPPRFEARPSGWAALLAAAHIQAAIAGNDLPRAAFVRTLQETFRTGRDRSRVTHVRIWNS